MLDILYEKAVELQEASEPSEVRLSPQERGMLHELFERHGLDHAGLSDNELGTMAFYIEEEEMGFDYLSDEQKQEHYEQSEQAALNSLHEEPAETPAKKKVQPLTEYQKG